MGLSTEGPGASRTVVRLLNAGIVSSLCQVMPPRPSAIWAWLLFLVSSDYPLHLSCRAGQSIPSGVLDD